eukprot:5324190-Amphidinium_carterae.1
MIALGGMLVAEKQVGVPWAPSPFRVCRAVVSCADNSENSEYHTDELVRSADLPRKGCTSKTSSSLA